MRFLDPAIVYASLTRVVTATVIEFDDKSEYLA